ncbi:MAG: phosphoribosyl-ATP diphosphatase [bacterium]|nr:phosphoribosyl-ATP diphosphatase [bacterium]
MSIEFLSELEQLLNERKSTLPEGSYTSTMFQKGLDSILQKVVEEAGEVVIAAKNTDEHEFKGEAADLLFHFLLMLVKKGVPLSDVIAVLEERHR